MVSFSGIDSSGKTTQINMLYDYCVKNGIRVKKIWGKARGTPGVMLVKSIVRRDRKMNFEQKMSYREQIYKSTVKKKLLLIASILDLCWYFGIYYRFLDFFNTVLICDRYIWDTYVELKTEFSGIEIDRWPLWKFAVSVSPKPETSFVFAITAEESLKRDAEKNDATPDSLNIKKAKISMYMDLMEEGKWTNVMDGLKPIDEIHKSILEVLRIEN